MSKHAYSAHCGFLSGFDLSFLFVIITGRIQPVFDIDKELVMDVTLYGQWFVGVRDAKNQAVWVDQRCCAGVFRVPFRAL